MVVLLHNLKNVFLVPELRKKCFFTFWVFIVYRLGCFIPLPGIDSEKLAREVQEVTGGVAAFLNYLDLVAGGALKRYAIFALGIGPYITASIMMQILTITIPSLEQLAKEGEYGRRIINQYTRYLTLFLSVVQGYGYAKIAAVNGFVRNPESWGFYFSSVLIVTVGSMFVMWLGEQISSHGIGNGSSMLIFGSIVAGLPGSIIRLVNDLINGHGGIDIIRALFLLAITLTVVVCVIFLEKGLRKIPIQYAKRVIGNKMYAGQSSYIPLKINPAGVVPVIFASNTIAMPIMLIQFLSTRFSFLQGANRWLDMNGILYNLLLAGLVIFFAFFYTAIIFNPVELADNLRKSGGFVPGIRPGRKTADFFHYVLTRVGFPGAVYLAVLVVFPSILIGIFKLHPGYVFSGTALLIIVGVALDISAQLESALIERRYEGFLATGKLRGRSGR